MADLKFTLIPDMRKMTKEINDLFKKRYSVNVDAKSTVTGSTTGTGGSGTSNAGVEKELKKGNEQDTKNSKKSSSMLGGILKSLGPLAILLSLKPVVDFLKIMAGYTVLVFLGINKLLDKWTAFKVELVKTIGEKIAMLWTTLKELLPQIWGKVVEWIGIAIDWLKELPGKIWTFIKEGFSWLINGIVELATKIGEFFLGIGETIWKWIRIGFDWIVEKLTLLWDGIKEVASSIWEFFKSAIEGVWTSVKKVWDGIKSVAGWIWDKMKIGFDWIKTGIANVWTSIKSLPGLIWDKIKQLATMIGNAIKGALPSLNPFKKTTSVNDAIIKPDGSVIRTHPQDTIIATKTPGNVGGGGSKIINLYGVTSQEMLNTIKRELATDINAQSRF